MIDQKELLEPSIVVFGYMLEEAINDGYKITDQYPVNFFGGQYHCILEKKAEKQVDNKVSEVIESVNEVSEVPTRNTESQVVTQETAKRGPKPKGK